MQIHRLPFVATSYPSQLDGLRSAPDSPADLNCDRALIGGERADLEGLGIPVRLVASARPGESRSAFPAADKQAERAGPEPDLTALKGGAMDFGQMLENDQKTMRSILQQVDAERQKFEAAQHQRMAATWLAGHRPPPPGASPLPPGLVRVPSSEEVPSRNPVILASESAYQPLEPRPSNHLPEAGPEPMGWQFADRM